MVKLADTPDSDSGEEIRAGSSPVIRTNIFSGYSAAGSALVWGARGHEFKSRYSDQKKNFEKSKFFFLSIAKAMVYHHALACISSPQAYIINRRLYRFCNDDIQCSALMIYRNKLRMIYKAKALIYLRKRDIINSPINKNL